MGDREGRDVVEGHLFEEKRVVEGGVAHGVAFFRICEFPPASLCVNINPYILGWGVTID